MTDLAPTVEISADPAPGPGGRIQRTTAQIGGTGILLELVIAFGWLGADHWTVRQGLAVSGAAYWTVSAAHNLFNWLRTERRSAPKAVTVEAVQPVPTLPDPGVSETGRRRKS